jgi:cytochrome c biogenesis protein CcdA
MTKTGSERKTAFVRVLLFILAVLLIFGGPTYAVYVLRHLAGLPYILVVLVGLIAFAVGILLFLRLIRKQTKLGASE